MVAAEAALAGPIEIAIAGDSAELVQAAWSVTSPGAVVIADAADVPLMEGRDLVGGMPAAYVCKGFVCERPVTTVEELVAVVSRRPAGSPPTDV